MITLTHFVILAVILFMIGIVGVIINTHNLIVMLLSVEVILLAGNILFVAFAYFHGNMEGQLFSMFLLAVTAAETAVALSIILLYFKRKKTVSMNQSEQMRG